MGMGKNVTSAIATSASMLAAAAAMARSKSLESQLKDVQEELRVKSIENNDLDTASKQHSQALASLQTAAQEQLEQALASMGEVLKDKEAQLEASEAAVSEQNCTMETLRAELQRKEDAASITAKQLEDSATTIADLQTKVASLESTIASSEENSLRTQEALSEEIHVAREAENHMMKQFEESACAISDFKQQVEALEIAKQELDVKWKESLKVIAVLETNVSSLQAQEPSIEVLQNEVRELSIQNDQLNASNLSLKQEKDRADAADGALECLRNESSLAIEELKLEVKRLTEKSQAVETLEKQLADEKRRASLAKVVLETKMAQMSEPAPPATVSAEAQPAASSPAHDDEELIRQLESKNQRTTEASTAQKSKRKAKGSK